MLFTYILGIEGRGFRIICILYRFFKNHAPLYQYRGESLCLEEVFPLYLGIEGRGFYSQVAKYSYFSIFMHIYAHIVHICTKMCYFSINMHKYAKIAHFSAKQVHIQLLIKKQIDIYLQSREGGAYFQGQQRLYKICMKSTKKCRIALKQY